MQRIKKIAVIVVCLLSMVGISVWLFLTTGGIGLVRLYQNYLSQDIPDKKYSGQDFTNRGPREMLHGYYAGAYGSGFYMWTFSGLKRFTHRQTTSVYYYLDSCGLIKQLEEGQDVKLVDGKSYIQETMYYDFDIWMSKMRRGNYVWVKRVGEGKDSQVIDKAWGNSNQYYPVETITTEQCEN